MSFLGEGIARAFKSILHVLSHVAGWHKQMMKDANYSSCLLFAFSKIFPM